MALEHLDQLHEVGETPGQAITTWITPFSISPSSRVRAGAIHIPARVAGSS